MTRVIKFRAWVPIIKEKPTWETDGMFYGVEDAYDTFGSMTDGDGKKKDYIWHSFGGALDKARSGELFLMQFTGLLDKNGKEIYEGDIVRWVNKHGVVLYDKAFIAWVYAGLAPCRTAQPTTSDYIGVLGSHWEIIGNIYENPELIAN